MTIIRFFKQFIPKPESPRTGVRCVRCERWVAELMFEGLCEQCVMCESFAYPKTLCDKCGTEKMKHSTT